MRAKNKIEEPPAFYKPITFKINNTPIIVYPCGGVEKILNRTDPKSIQNHIEALFRETFYKGNRIKQADFYITILWENNNKIMTDFWIYNCEWDSGALTDTKIFENYKLTTNFGTSAENGLILLGEEAKKRKRSKSIKEYINRKRPRLPCGLNPKQDFYKTDKKTIWSIFIGPTMGWFMTKSRKLFNIKSVEEGEYK